MLYWNGYKKFNLINFYSKNFSLAIIILFIGLHSYYDIDKVRSSNCTDVSPFFLLFNQKEDQMHGFGFQTVGRVKENPGSRFETPRPVDIAVSSFSRI